MHLQFKLGGRGSHSSDKFTRSLVSRGVYRIPDIYEDREIDRFGDTKVAYSFWSAAKYTFILSLLLWWLPIFGQMIAGYVGGRRAGTPNKGMLAALVPVIAIFALFSLADMGYLPSTINGTGLSSGELVGAIAVEIPILEPYLNFIMNYLSSFLDAIQTTTSLRLDSYIITVAFAYVGGILADQTRKEMEFVARHGAPKTTVVVEGPQPTRQTARGDLRFEDLTPMGGDSEFAALEGAPLRAAKRKFDEEDEDVEDLRRLKQTVKKMSKDQREVEKKVRRKRSDSPLGSLVGRSKAKEDEGQDDWEFI